MQFLSLSRRRTDAFPPEAFTPDLLAGESRRVRELYASGITDYAQNSLGDIVYVDVPKVGDSVTANQTFGSVESVKAVSDLYSPVSGTVTAINEALKTEPDKINAAPHETWIIKVELSNTG